MSSVTLSENLRRLLDNNSERNITVGSVIGAVGDKGYGLILVVLSLPSALPIPAPGYSTPFGIMLAFLGGQMVLGRRSVWLPQWAIRSRIKRSLAVRAIQGANAFFTRLEHLIKPRFTWIGGNSSCLRNKR